MIQNATENTAVTKVRKSAQGPTPEQISRAVALCYWEWRLTDEQRAAQLGICRRTLGRWKKRADFQALYEAVVQEEHRRTLEACIEQALRRGAEMRAAVTVPRVRRGR